MEDQAKYLIEPNSHTFAYKAKILFFILIAISAVLLLGYISVSGFIEVWQKTHTPHLYINASAWAVPLLISLPVFIALAYVLSLRLFNKLTQSKLDKLMKTGIVLFIPFVVARVFYGYWLDSYLENNGYHYCYYYSSASALGGNNYLINPDFCMEKASLIRKEIIVWMDEQVSTGKTLSDEFIKQEISRMADEDMARRKEEYPEIYD